MVKGEMVRFDCRGNPISSYSGSYLGGLNRYSKNEGIGYLSPLGEEEGSENFLSTTGCRPEGNVGFPALIICVVEEMALNVIVFCIARFEKFNNLIRRRTHLACPFI